MDAFSSEQRSRNDWRILGELELPIEAECNQVIASWLKENLSPLKLQVDFIDRILKSAQAAVMRTEESSIPATETGHIHIAVFAPINRELEGKTWGFFRIEKLEGSEQDKKPSDHSIEFYLYMEGN